MAKVIKQEEAEKRFFENIIRDLQDIQNKLYSEKYYDAFTLDNLQKVKLRLIEEMNNVIYIQQSNCKHNWAYSDFDVSTIYNKHGEIVSITKKYYYVCDLCKKRKYTV